LEKLNKKIMAVSIIGLVVGLVLGILVSILWIFPSSIPAGQVLVSGTVSNIWGSLSGNDILYFDSVDQTIEMSAPVTNGHYSIVLVAGLSYYVFLDNNPPIENRSTYTPFRWMLDVPLGVTTFTQNFVMF
jgi:hypothetical protein